MGTTKVKLVTPLDYDHTFGVFEARSTPMANPPTEGAEATAAQERHESMRGSRHGVNMVLPWDPS